jgi:hypothetical protein
MHRVAARFRPDNTMESLKKGRKQKIFWFSLDPTFDLIISKGGTKGIVGKFLCAFYSVFTPQYSPENVLQNDLSHA